MILGGAGVIFLFCFIVVFGCIRATSHVLKLVVLPRVSREEFVLQESVQKPVLMNLSHLFTECRDHLADASNQRQVAISFDGFLEDAVFVGDRVQVQAALTCLLAHAINYSRPESVVRVTWGTLSDRTVVTGEISSVGDVLVENDVYQRFGEFFRAGLKSIADFPDALGLFFAKQVIEESGGSIWVEYRDFRALLCFSLPVGKIEELPNQL